MKKYIIPAILSIAFVFGATAQGESNDLQGPAYKNRKPWNAPKPATTIQVKTGENKQGAGVKTLLPLERKVGDVQSFQVAVEKNELQGPAFKNRKLWKQESKVESGTPDLIAAE